MTGAAAAYHCTTYTTSTTSSSTATSTSPSASLPPAERDVSERIALGQAVPNSTETLYDQRLFNQSAWIGSGFTAQDDAYNIYDKALCRGGAAAESLYRPTRGAQEDEWADEEKAAENVLKRAERAAAAEGCAAGENRQRGRARRVRGGRRLATRLDQFLSEAKAARPSTRSARLGDGGGGGRRVGDGRLVPVIGTAAASRENNASATGSGTQIPRARAPAGAPGASGAAGAGSTCGAQSC